MVALAVFITIAVCLLIDWLLQRRADRRTALTPSPERPTFRPEFGQPAFAGGFRFQEELAYHPGHTWVSIEGPDRARIGIDDFARRLLGPELRIDLPPRDAQLQQGQPGWSLQRDGRHAPLLSPLSGRVLEVNERLRTEPDLLQRDPYGEGWLLVVRPQALRANLNNLLSGRLVGHWLEEVAARLRTHMHGPLTGEIGFSMPDGGTAVEDIGGLLTDEEWSAAVREFLLTDP